MLHQQQYRTVPVATALEVGERSKKQSCTNLSGAVVLRKVSDWRPVIGGDTELLQLHRQLVVVFLLLTLKIFAMTMLSRCAEATTPEAIDDVMMMRAWYIWSSVVMIAARSQYIMTNRCFNASIGQFQGHRWSDAIARSDDDISMPNRLNERLH